MTEPVKYWTIGPHKAKVIQEVDPSEEACGWCSNSSMEVHIGPDLSPTRKVEVELHELLHLLICDVGLNETVEELLVMLLARGLATFIQDNPRVIREWGEGLER